MIFLRAARLVSRRASWLWRLGLAADPSARLDDAAIDALRGCVSGFLRSGGVLTGREFASLTSVERAACAVAGDELRAQIAAAIGIASQGRMEAASILAPADGGRAKAQMILERLALEGAREMHQAPASDVDGRMGIYEDRIDAS